MDRAEAPSLCARLADHSSPIIGEIDYRVRCSIPGQSARLRGCGNEARRQYRKGNSRIIAGRHCFFTDAPMAKGKISTVRATLGPQRALSRMNIKKDGRGTFGLEECLTRSKSTHIEVI
jgi:hypothetical protein